MPIHHNYLIELLNDAGEYVVAYSGATGHHVQREAAHMDLVGGSGRVAASVAKHGPKRHRVRLVHKMEADSEEGASQLPFKVRCLETYLMEKHKTRVHKQSKIRDRLAHANRDHDYKHPDVSLPDQPMNFQLNCIRSVGKQHDKAVAEAGKVYESQTTTLCIYTEKEQEKVYQQIFKELDIEPLETILVACSKPEDPESKRVVFDIDSPFMKARELRVKYEDMDGWEVVSADRVTVGVNAVKDMAPEDKDLAAYLRVLLAACHPDRHTDLTAGEAHGLFRMIEGWTGRREEAALLKKAKEAKEVETHVATAVKWREFMRQSEGSTPSRTPTSGRLKTLEEKRAEKTLGVKMHTWRTGQNSHPPQEARNVYLVILRDFPSFAQYCYGKAEKTHSNVTKANILLRAGHGTVAARKAFPNLVNFPSTCPACYADRSEYRVLSGYLAGQNGTTEAALLDGVDPEYATWLRKTHVSKVDDLKAKQAKARKKQTAAQHASGLVKKRAREDQEESDDDEEEEEEEEDE